LLRIGTKKTHKVAEEPNIEGLFGGEAGGEKESTARGAGADALALAVALQKSPHDPELARAASDYLATQRQLAQLQIRHVDEELRLVIAAAKRKRYSDRIRNALATLVALLVLALVLAVVRLTVEAIEDHGLVVERFSVPADLAAQGMSGEAFAESLVNRVAAIRRVANENSLGVTEEVRTVQGGGVRVEIPQTGISLDELEHFAHRWLGQEVLVSGVVHEDPDDMLSVSLHIAGAEPIEVKGPRSDLEKLMQQTAERAFESFDSENYVIYLRASGRDAEAYEVFLRAIAELDSGYASRRDLGNAYSLLAALDPNQERAFERLMTSIDLDPKLMTVQIEGARMSADLGHDQAAYDFALAALQTRIADQVPRLRPGYRSVILEARMIRDEALGDFNALRADYEDFEETAVRVYAARAQVAAQLHDEAGAEQALARLRSAVGATDRRVARALWYASAAKGDWPSAAGAAQALIDVATADAARATPREFAAASELQLQTLERPRLAESELMMGDASAASREMASSPQDCYGCTQLRARIAAANGNWGEAHRLFAESVRQAPQLPAAYFRWGESLLAAGKYTDAVQQLSLAHDKGPHFADPLKAWGDALVKQGQLREALGKYNQALKYAPNWAALKSARDAVARRLG
jgi:tetratricopeptide (TPR) repeat protein